MEASGEYRLGEAKGADWLISRRVGGYPRWQMVGVLVALYATVFAAYYLADILALDAVVVVLLSLLGVGAGLRLVWVAWWRASLNRAWIARGVIDPSVSSFRVQDNGFAISGQNSEMLWKWSAVSEIARGDGFWCFIGPGVGSCVPRRFFSDEASERAFLREALERMSESGRARSRDATAFVGL